MKLPLLLNTCLVTSIILSLQTAGYAETRSFLGADPATIEQYLGGYWTRLTRQQPGKRLVTYTYNPQQISRLFPDATVSKLEVQFINQQASSVSVWMSLTLKEFGENGYPLELEPLFKYFSGEQPSTQSSVYRRLIQDGSADPGGTLHQNIYCISPGIAMSYEYASERNLAINVSFFQDEQCQELKPSASPTPKKL